MPSLSFSILLAGLAHSCVLCERCLLLISFFTVSASVLAGAFGTSVVVCVQKQSAVEVPLEMSFLIVFWDLLPHEEVCLSFLPARLRGGGPLKEPPGHKMPF